MNYTSRKDWGARSPKGNPSRIRRTIRGIGVHSETVDVEDHDGCTRVVKKLQDDHMRKNRWNDLAYSWVVCEHGEILEGRGWGVRTTANGTNAGNAHYHSVSYVGGDLTAEGKRALREVIETSKEEYGDEVRPHNFFRDSAPCPNPEVNAWLDAGMPVEEESSTPTPEPELDPVDDPDQPLVEVDEDDDIVFLASKEDPESPPEGTISEVLEWVGDDSDRAVAAYEAEEAGRNRPTLKAALERLV